ncbi:hypothetical protein M422DRAFT_48738 [Sphaerobolus stellatus SS14]|uniref:Uncharacterized protein n=1 Tax=Sphaerobolus stellatus (strain SS14) TaxID=990650 RepID=A0A0C9V2M7_SPHS4|nr:hypothetical protein M422DRAFT_48738 [Sphaerobolus stellatus SS14]
MADIDFVPIDIEPFHSLTLLVILVPKAFVSGLVTFQTFSYYQNSLNLKDLISLKFYVLSVWLLAIAHLIVIFLFVYYYNVFRWALCQFFFIYRVYILSRRNWLLVAILTFFRILQAVMGIWISVDGLNGQTMRDFLDFNVGRGFVIFT